MTDQFASQPLTLNSPAERAFAISPHDTNPLALTTRAVWVGTTGDLAALLVGDTTAVTFVNVPDGTLMPIRAKLVLDTGTDATNLVGLA